MGVWAHSVKNMKRHARKKDAAQCFCGFNLREYVYLFNRRQQWWCRYGVLTRGDVLLNAKIYLAWHSSSVDVLLSNLTSGCYNGLTRDHRIQVCDHRERIPKWNARKQTSTESLITLFDIHSKSYIVMWKSNNSSDRILKCPSTAGQVLLIYDDGLIRKARPQYSSF